MKLIDKHKSIIEKNIRGSKSFLIQKEEFSPWPFIIPIVRIKLCEVGLIISVNNKKYALSGSALRKHKNCDEIWLDNPDIPGAKISLTPIIDYAFKVLK